MNGWVAVVGKSREMSTTGPESDGDELDDDDAP